MNTPLIVVLLILVLANLIVAILVLVRRGTAESEPVRPLLEGLMGETRRVEQSLRDELGRQREEAARGGGLLREELSGQVRTGLESLLARQDEGRRGTEERLDASRTATEKSLQVFGDSIDQRFMSVRRELNDNATQTRTDLRQALTDFQKQNETKLEEIRRTVDEKLQSTLEKRLGESFKLVSERLEAVHQRLGEVQSIASSVGDLQRVLTNVKTRGTWGEIQLGALLEQVLTAEQYSANVAVRPDSGERVDFAIRLPGRDDHGTPVWLPVDSKFPQEDYLRLLDAVDRADAVAAAEAGQALENRIRSQAREIQQKYVAPPHTTDFAILFLPSEGLYAEALRRPGLADVLQRENRIVLSGPTTLAALLNSLQMGFRTLAIQQRSGEVWTLLGAVKTEFGRFGDVIAKVKRKLDEASNQIDETARRSRVIDRKLRAVEALPAPDAARLLPDVAPVEGGEGE